MGNKTLTGRDLSLQGIWQRCKDDGYETDKGSIHSYIEIYEELLSPYRNRKINVLEVGIFNGASLLMWEQYFHNGTVYGIDCHEQPHGGLADLRPMIADGYNIVIGDAENPLDIEKHFRGLKFDVVIEDAGHQKEQQENIYAALKPYLNKGFIYIIEDIQDIDYNRRSFETIDSSKEVEILDRRHIKGRYDDVIVIIRDKK